MDKLKIGWSIRAKRYEDRIRNREGSIVKQCWREKEKGGWNDIYGVERSGCYLRNGWEVEESRNRVVGKEFTEEELIRRERDSARAEENRKISEARYNRNYKEILAEGYQDILGKRI